MAAGLPRVAIPLSEIAELDRPFRLDGSDDVPTYREIAGHARLIAQADLGFPIILGARRNVMDGMHRVMKALNAGVTTIDALIFQEDPPPDYVDVMPDDLPYPDVP